MQNVLLAPDLCDRLFPIITLLNSGHTCLFHKGFCNVYFKAKEKNAVTLPHSAQRKHAFWEEIKEITKTKKLSSRREIALELLHHRLGHRSTRSLLDVDSDYVWEDIELRIYPDPFCTLCKISSMNKKARSKNIINPKATFNCIFVDIIPSTSPKSLTSDTTFSNYL